MEFLSEIFAARYSPKAVFKAVFLDKLQVMAVQIMKGYKFQNQINV